MAEAVEVVARAEATARNESHSRCSPCLSRNHRIQPQAHRRRRLHPLPSPTVSTDHCRLAAAVVAAAALVAG